MNILEFIPLDVNRANVYTRYQRFIDDSHDVKTGNDSSIFGGLTLGVVEVGGHSDNGMSYGFTEVGFGSFLHLDQNHGRDLFGCELLVGSSYFSLNNLREEIVNIGNMWYLEFVKQNVYCNSLSSTISHFVKQKNLSTISHFKKQY